MYLNICFQILTTDTICGKKWFLMNLNHIFSQFTHTHTFTIFLNISHTHSVLLGQTFKHLFKRM